MTPMQRRRQNAAMSEVGCYATIPGRAKLLTGIQSAWIKPLTVWGETCAVPLFPQAYNHSCWRAIKGIAGLINL
jgi:hypothetical protein